MLYILAGILVLGFFCYALVAGVPKSDYERRLDDEEQIKYLKNLKNK